MEVPESFSAAPDHIYTSAILSCIAFQYGKINRTLVKISYKCPLFVFVKMLNALDDPIIYMLETLSLHSLNKI